MATERATVVGGGTVTPAMVAALRQLGAAMKRKRGSVSVEMVFVHLSPDAGILAQAVAPGVRAPAWERFVSVL